MADILQTGLNWLENQRRQFMTQPATYRRGADSVQINVTLGKTQYQAGDDSGMVIAAEVMDFIVATADLQLNGINLLPEAGDTIQTDRGTYQVMFLSGDGFWRYSDPYGNAIRIHAKQIS